MHPDLLAEGLKRELARLDAATPDYDQRKARIESELAALKDVERPEIPVELGSLEVPDARRQELLGLRRELERAPRERHDQIKAQIKQIEQTLGGEMPDTDTKPSTQEVEERKQARTGRKVEQARQAPVPDQPAPGAKE